MNRLYALLLAFLLLSGCGGPTAQDDGRTHILCTTYPVYLFTTAVTQGTQGLEVELLVNQQTSCLHDYTLTVADMRAIEAADVIVVSGAGLEDFMADALAQSDASVIDCSAGLTLLPTLEHAGHDGHDHGEEFDPHYWMDPERAQVMLGNIAAGLDEALYGDTSQGEFQNAYYLAAETVYYTFRRWRENLEKQPLSPLITFHDGFSYFADAFGLELLKAIEEEEGAEASAKELEEIIDLVKEYQIPAIFVEKNGSRRSADVIARETGCAVYELDLLMSGEGVGMEPYIQAMKQNLTTVLEALG